MTKPHVQSSPPEQHEQAASGDVSHTGGLTEERHWHPRGDVVVAKSSLVEIDELNPSGASVGVMQSAAAHGFAQLLTSGQLMSADSVPDVEVRTLARRALSEAGIDVSAVKADFESTRASRT